MLEQLQSFMQWPDALMIFSLLIVRLLTLSQAMGEESV
jgi:hypothetical protein